MKKRSSWRREYYKHSLKFIRSMHERKAKLYNKHIDADGRVHVPVYINSLGDCCKNMIITDDVMSDILSQVERALKIYKTGRLACIYIYTPDVLPEEFRAFFIHRIQNATQTEFIGRRRRFIFDLISLTMIFILGILLFYISQTLSGIGSPAAVTAVLSVITNVMMWELVDYMIRYALPSLRDLQRIIQIGTATFTLRQWD